MSPRQLEIPPGISALGPEAVGLVERLVAAAEERQDAELRGSLEKSLRMVPRPVRGVVRRVLGA
jgi:hypothetical protein